MNKINPESTILVSKRRGTITLGPRNELAPGDNELPVTFSLTFGKPDEALEDHEAAENSEAVTVDFVGALQIDFGQVARLEMKLEQLATIHQEPPREERI